MKQWLRLSTFFLTCGAAWAEAPQAGKSVTPGSGIPGLRNVRTVMGGILSRGGGPAYKMLSERSMRGLCEQGFSGGVYAYDDGYTGPTSVDCVDASGVARRFEYQSIGFRSRRDRQQFMALLYDVILQNKGPVYVHCWNGWHASGEMSALALMQFCGYSGADAADYWAANVGDPENLGNYGRIRKGIAAFQAFEEFVLDEKTRARVCP